MKATKKKWNVMGKLTAVDLFVGHIGAIVGAVAEFDALDALGSTAG